MDHAHRTILTHVQLYLTCMRTKQHRREKKIQIMTQLPQTAVSTSLEGAKCREIKDGETSEVEAGGDEAIE